MMERREFIIAAGAVAAAGSLQFSPALAVQTDLSAPILAQFDESLSIYHHRLIRIRGYLTPPIAPYHHYFILAAHPDQSDPTGQPVSPSESPWESTLIKVYPRQVSPLRDAGLPIEVTGRLTVGECHDIVTDAVARQVITNGMVRLLATA